MTALAISTITGARISTWILDSVHWWGMAGSALALYPGRVARGHPRYRHILVPVRPAEDRWLA